MAGHNEQDLNVPPQGVRIPRGRHGGIIVPDSPLSSSDQGLTGGLPAGSPAEAASAEVIASAISGGSAKPVCAPGATGDVLPPGQAAQDVGASSDEELFTVITGRRRNGRARIVDTPEAGPSCRDAETCANATADPPIRLAPEWRAPEQRAPEKMDASSDETVVVAPRKESRVAAGKGKKRRAASSAESPSSPEHSDSRAEWNQRSTTLKDPVPAEIGQMPLCDLGNKALELLGEVEQSRQSSKSLKGTISGVLKKNVKLLSSVVTVLVSRVEQTGDAGYQKMKNIELQSEVRVLKEEQRKLAAELALMKKTLDQQKAKNAKEEAAQKTSEAKKSPDKQGGPPRLEKKGKGSAPQQPREGKTSPGPVRPESGKAEAPVMRPPLRGRSDPIPDPPRAPIVETEEDRIQRIVMKTLMSLMTPETASRLQQPAVASYADAARKPRIISNTQIVPPRKQAAKAPPAISKGPKGPQNKQGVTPLAKGQNKSVNKTSPKKRLPRKAVVAITGRTPGFSYAEALKAARQEISLKDLGIDASRIKRAANGGILMEIGGPEGAKKADDLAAKLRQVMGDKAAVSRPMKKAEARIIGLDDSVTTEEVRDRVAEEGECSAELIRAGPIRAMNNGLGIAWIQGPLEAIVKVASKERIRIGWTTVRVESVGARPLQCFKCWRFGHVQSRCTGNEDRAGACFRCGQKGHVASRCTLPVKCVVCEGNGIAADHRIGTSGCGSKKSYLMKMPARRAGSSRNSRHGP